MRYLTSIFLFTQLACVSLSPSSTAALRVPTPRIAGVYTPAEIAELIRQWDEADGESVLVVSDRLAFFLTANPIDFYAAMASHQKQLGAWLSRLGGTTFTEFGNGCIDRRCLRQQMIRAAESSRGLTEKAESIRLEILTALRKTQVRNVD